eukprot:CAMPEP_0176235518 /NCGR_PEP_ID=MMETSP0121_2-20121125/26878_1 /TAXON_ID=160619 /ORGANISM="Kryptoperidinium foliaceum, Strain CCMP 1326" /LENGTH=321 /DNA_ID=CAMNT_0017574939 /DNA_START=761 /DNA_END=1723 /DNA_ORIENTATION=+
MTSLANAPNTEPPAAAPRAVEQNSSSTCTGQGQNGGRAGIQRGVKRAVGQQDKLESQAEDALEQTQRQHAFWCVKNLAGANRILIHRPLEAFDCGKAEDSGVTAPPPGDPLGNGLKDNISGPRTTGSPDRLPEAGGLVAGTIRAAGNPSMSSAASSVTPASSSAPRRVLLALLPSTPAALSMLPVAPLAPLGPAAVHRVVPAGGGHGVSLVRRPDDDALADVPLAHLRALPAVHRVLVAAGHSQAVARGPRRWRRCQPQRVGGRSASSLNRNVIDGKPGDGNELARLQVSSGIVGVSQETMPSSTSSTCRLVTFNADEFAA